MAFLREAFSIKRGIK